MCTIVSTLNNKDINNIVKLNLKTLLKKSNCIMKISTGTKTKKDVDREVSRRSHVTLWAYDYNNINAFNFIHPTLHVQWL